MKSDEFEKVWTLYKELFPAASRLRSKNTRTTWQMALSPYAMEDVVNASLDWARRSKFFPDISDITGNLVPERAGASSEARERVEKRQGSCPPEYIPYVQKTFGKCAERRKRQLHGAGLRTWFEAQAEGVSWLDWLASCRAVYGGALWPARQDDEVLTMGEQMEQKNAALVGGEG